MFTPSHRIVDSPVPVVELPLVSLANPLDLSDRSVLQAHIDRAQKASPSGMVWGGYLEQRNIYSTSSNFQVEGMERDIHLGIDIWADAGTVVYAPLAGRVHSFQDNTGFSNYGPTIVVEHSALEGSFFTLYGHLSRSSLQGLEVGMDFPGGAELCRLGAWDENGDWPPHLHFQLITDMGEWWGDFPGASTAADLDRYRIVCPDPATLLVV